MLGWNEELLAGLSTTPWQPQSLRAAPGKSLSRRLRWGLLAGVAVLHVVVALLLLALVERNRQPAEQDAIVVDFIDAPAPSVEPANETITIRMPPPLAQPGKPRAAPTPTAAAPATSTKVE